MAVPATAGSLPAGEGEDAAVVPHVAFERVCRSFGAVAANDCVSFGVQRGRITALLGENGAGKTTAMNILSGLYVPDSGRVLIDGRPLAPGSPRASLAVGIGMVHQQFKLIERLTGFENISLALHRGAFLQPRGPDGALLSLMTSLGFDIDLERRVWQMPLAVRQQLEILRVLVLGANILVLDEPTSVLSPLETRSLFERLRQIARSGRSVVLISHKLDDVMAAADDVIVMRRGKVVHQGPKAGLGQEDLARLIVGSRSPATTPPVARALGRPVLKVSDLCVMDDQDRPAVNNVSFEVKEGELVVMVGVAGNGQIELFDAIGGLRPVASGNVQAPRDVDGRRDFAFIPAQHLGVGLAPGLSIALNAILGHHARPPFKAWLRRRQVMEFAQDVIGRFAIELPLQTPVNWLSGGNLQRLMLGRELQRTPSLIVASYPTRGLDIALASSVRNALVAAAGRGAAVLVSTEELDESLAIATRILAFSKGGIVASLDPASMDPQAFGPLLTGGRG